MAKCIFFFSNRLESTFPPLNPTLIRCFCHRSFFICISWRLRFLLHLCQEIFWPSHQLNTGLCLNSLHPKAAPRDDVFLMGLIKARSPRGAVTSTYHSVRLGSFWIKRFIFFPISESSPSDCMQEKSFFCRIRWVLVETWRQATCHS